MISSTSIGVQIYFKKIETHDRNIYKILSKELK